MDLYKSDREAGINLAVGLVREQGESVRGAAKRTGVPESTLRGALKRVAADAYHSVNPDGSAVFEGEGDSDAILRAHGEDPGDWEIVSLKAGRWGRPEDPQESFRISAVRKSSLLQIPDLSDYEFPGIDPNQVEFDDGTVVFAGDQHAPHYDKGLHSAFLQFLRDEAPMRLVLLGDTGDFSTISRHRNTEGFAQGLNEINDSVVRMLLDYRHASPNTQIVMLRGNHDDRLEYAIIDNNPEYYRVRPGLMESAEEIPSLSLRRLWHLDELGIELIDEEWKRAKYRVTETLTARHGYMTSPTTGSKMLGKHSNSQIQGHSHRMGFTFLTKHDPLDTRVAIEAGTMAEIMDGLGYEDEPNWQQGFVYGATWDDGDFALAPAVYIKDRLLLPDGRRYYSQVN